MKIRVVFKIICLWALLLVLASCATGRINLVETGRVSLDVVAAQGISVAEAKVYQDGDKLVVEGRVESRYDIQDLRNGQVDITIIGPDGKVIRQLSAPYKTKMLTFGPKGLSRMAARQAYFEQAIPVSLPEGSSVRLEFHD